MSDHSRPLPERPNLRYLKLEAKRRLAAGEFATLHEAQLAVAREHGMSSWTALKQFVASRQPASPALTQLRWVLSRFEDAGSSTWVAPDDEELRQHFDDSFLRVVPPATLITTLTPIAAQLREQLVVTEDTPTRVLARIAGRQVQAVVDAAVPNRLVGLRIFRPGSVADARVASPTSRTSGDVPDPVPDIADAEFGELALPGLVFAAGEPGAALWSLARGWADLDRGEVLRPEHRFPAHSVTKLVTATAVLRLVADGRIALHGPANDHLATVRLADDTVTVAELLSHTGGVRDPRTTFGDHVPDLPSLLGPVVECDGTRGEFSSGNGSYAVLGQLISDVTAKPYPEAVARLVFEPLGMRDSTFPTSWPQTDAVTGYVLSEGIFRPAPRQIWQLPAAGGLWTTAADLVRFGIGWSRLLPAVLAGEAITPRAERPGGHVGLGWLLDRTGEVMGHPGGGAGGAVSLVVRLRGGRTHVALANRQIPIEQANGRVLRATDRS
jgi:CubicO group peptidase (beta-lactamase class C family)